MVQMNVECRFVRDVLKGDDTNELRVELKGMVKNVMCDEYKEWVSVYSLFILIVQYLEWRIVW